MKCLLLMSFSHNDNYCHANVPLLAVPMQTNVNIDWYPNSLIAPIDQDKLLYLFYNFTFSVVPDYLLIEHFVIV